MGVAYQFSGIFYQILQKKGIDFTPNYGSDEKRKRLAHGAVHKVRNRIRETIRETKNGRFKIPTF